MQLKSYLKRLNEHPVLLAINVVAGIVTVFSWLPIFNLPMWICVVIIVCLVALIIVTDVLTAETESTALAKNAVDVLPTDVSQTAKGTCSSLPPSREMVRAAFRNRPAGNDTVTYFWRWAGRHFEHASVEREVIENFAKLDQYRSFCEAVDEWVSIGFKSMTQAYPGMGSKEFVDKLYAAALQAMLKEEPPLCGMQAFAERISSEAGRRIRSGL